MIHGDFKALVNDHMKLTGVKKFEKSLLLANLSESDFDP